MSWLLVMIALSMTAQSGTLHAQREESPTLVIGEVAAGGDLRVTAYGVAANTLYRLRLLPSGPAVWLEPPLLSDGRGNVGPATVALPPGTPAGLYSLELVRVRGDIIDASERFTVRPGPLLRLSPDQAAPGSRVEVTVENLLGGTVQIRVGDGSVLGPIPVMDGQFSGSFTVPDPEGARGLEVTAINRQGDRVVGRGSEILLFQPGANWGEVRVSELSLADSSLALGRAFTLRGSLTPPPTDPAQVQIAPFWRTAQGRQIPIGLGPALIQADGRFEVTARTPSLLQGDPFFAGGGDAVGVMVNVASAHMTEALVAVGHLFQPQTGFAVIPVKDMPGSPQDGQPIPNLPAPAPGSPNPIQVQIEPLGVFSSTLSEGVDIDGILPVLDINSAMFQLELQQTMEFLGNYVPNCIQTFDIATDIKRWEWVMGPHETTILTQYEQVMNPFVNTAKFNSIAQFNAGQQAQMPGRAQAAQAEGEPVAVQLFAVLIDAIRVVDGGQQGYGFVNEFGMAVPFTGYFAYVPSHNLTFAVRPLAEGDSFEAIPMDSPARVRIPPLPAGWQSSFQIHTITLPGQSRSIAGSGMITPLPDVIEFGTYRTLVKPAYGGGINPAIQLLSTAPMEVEVRLIRYGESLTIPDVRMSYRGTPLAVTRVEVPDDTPAPAVCSKSGPNTNPLNIYRWRATIHAGHTQPAGEHDLVITAEEGGTVESRTARLRFAPYPDWFDGGNMTQRRVNWSPTAVTLQASPTTVGSNVQANVPNVGNRNSQISMGQQQITCVLGLANTGQLSQSGSMNSVALNNDASPLGYSGNGGCSGNQLAGGMAASARSGVTKVSLLDTGYLTVFSMGFGIPGIAWVGISVDFRVQASAAINTTVPSAVQTLFDAGVEVGGTVSIDVLLGLASGSGQFLADIGVQIPTTFRLDGQVIEPGKCFYYGLNVRVRIKAFWQTVYNKVHPIFRGSSPSNCYQGWGVAMARTLLDFSQVIPSQEEDGPEVPNAGPALATDGLGQTLLLWSTEEDELLYSRLLGGTWSDPLPVSPGSRGGDPALAFYAPGQAVAVWSQSSLMEEPHPDTPLADVLRHQHLLYATWDGAAWSPAQPLTQPTTGDGMAALAGCMSTDPACPSGGAVTAVWVHDPAGDFTQRRFNLRYATFANGGWGAIQTLEDDPDRSDTEPSLVYHQGTPALLWVRDGDRNFETFQERRLALAFLSGQPAIQTLSGLPAGVMDPSLAVDGQGNLQVAFNVVDAGDSPLGNRRMLYRARGECAGTNCAWQSTPVKDPAGRTILAERPVINVAPVPGGEEVILTYRAMGLNPVTVPPSPLFNEPEPVGVADRTGELAQLSLPLALGSGAGNPGYLTQNGAVNWQPAAIYEPLLNSVVALAVQEQSLAQRRSDSPAQGAARTVAHGSPLVMAATPQLPNFVLKHARFEEGPQSGSGDLTVLATVLNAGAAWSDARESGPLRVHARWGDPAGPLAGEADMDELGQAESVPVKMAISPPPQPNQGQFLYLILNPGQPIPEQSGLDNVYALAYPGLPAPFNLHAHTVPDHPTLWLTWEGETDKRVAGYRIYRLDGQGGAAPVGSSFVNGWMDTTVAWGEGVRYGVVAFGEDMAESEMAVIDAQAGLPPGSGFQIFMPLIER